MIELRQDYFVTRVCYIEETKALDAATLGPIRREASEDDKTGVYIKVHNIVSMGKQKGNDVTSFADGRLAPQVYVFHDSNLKKDTFFAEFIDDFCASTGEGGTWIVGINATAKTCPAFISWYMSTAVFPFLSKRRASTAQPNTPVFFSFDGEEAVLTPMLLDDAVTSKAKELNVLIVKHFASGSAVSNALDAGNIHKSTKKSIKHQRSAAVMEENPVPIQRIQAAIRKHSPQTTPAHSELVARMIVRIVVSYQQVVTTRFGVDSFVATGQLIPPNSAHKDFLDSKIALCTNWSKLTSAQHTAIRAAFRKCVELVKSNGMITEEEMDELGIPADDELVEGLTDRRVKPKDERPLHNQRGAVVNHAEVHQAFTKYQVRCD